MAPKIIPYVPNHRVKPARLLEGWPTSWHPNEEIIEDILERFKVKINRSIALEIGSEHGHSAIALSNYFEHVIAVDPWMQRITDQSRPMFDVCMENFSPYENIHPCRMEWQLLVRLHGDSRYDLIHYDGDHSYEQTYAAGCWAMEHSNLLIAHDTRNGWTDVTPALTAVADRYKVNFYNFEEGEGLGILTL